MLQGLGKVQQGVRLPYFDPRVSAVSFGGLHSVACQPEDCVFACRRTYVFDSAADTAKIPPTTAEVLRRESPAQRETPLPQDDKAVGVPDSCSLPARGIRAIALSKSKAAGRVPAPH